MGKQEMFRTFSLDAAHKLLRNLTGCASYHGHTYLGKLTYSFEKTEEIGYALDFKEVKRVHIQFLLDYFDHTFIANPLNTKIIDLCLEEAQPVWVMSLNDKDFCNPSAENIGREMFLSVEYLTRNYPQLKLESLQLHETPNCAVVTYPDSISDQERTNFLKNRQALLENYAKEKGVMEYDSNKCAV